MSFSSREWTIPEVCVWVATRSADAVNVLPADVRDSFGLTIGVCPSAYAARDELIKAAQEGAIEVTVRDFERALGSSLRYRRPLQPSEWATAEIVEIPSGCAIDRRGDHLKPVQYEPLVVRAGVLARWPARDIGTSAAPSAPVADHTAAARAVQGPLTLQGRFDAELRRRFAEEVTGQDGHEDPMVQWAQRELKVSRPEAEALWQTRGPEFSRGPGRPAKRANLVGKSG